MSIGYDAIQQSLDDGTADEIVQVTGAIAVETLLKEQDVERTWKELDDEERTQLREMMQCYADQKGFTLTVDDESCIVSSDPNE